jgi:hypothetical protein
MVTSANHRLIARLPRTAFKPGQSGNPRGRKPGTQRKITVEAREAAKRIVDDPAYREELRARMIGGTAGAMEPLMWLYAKGKPVERAEPDQSSELSKLTNEELRTRIAATIAKL